MKKHALKKENQHKFEVRDMRVREKFQIDDAYLNGYAKKCGIYATGVYVSLCRHVDKEQKCWPSLKKIAEELGISEKQVGRSINSLEAYNIIVKIRKGKKLNNRYILLDKSEWTDSPITKDSQSYHYRTDSPIHSKDTHIKDTHKKGALSIEEKKLAPAEEMNLFLEEDKILFNRAVDYIAEKHGIEKTMVANELEKFKSYWSELNKSGKKQRWELQETFQLGRRIGTWFRNMDQFRKQKQEKSNEFVI
jgi:biotin operon repressor